MKYNLSEITEVITNRRTIYPEQFSERQVQKEQIELLLNNAIWAPTHGNTQPWRFKVFMESALDKLGDFLATTYASETASEDFKPMKEQKLRNRPKAASAVIAICMQRQDTQKISEIDEIAAVACAVQNIHLTCTGYGLAGFWSTPKFLNSEAVKTYLELGSNDRCLGLFYVGYPAIEWPKGQRKPIEYVTEWRNN